MAWRALPSAPPTDMFHPRASLPPLLGALAADDKVGMRWPRTSLRNGVSGVADSMLARPRVSLTISQGWVMIRYPLSESGTKVFVYITERPVSEGGGSARVRQLPK